jgi:MoaA/NifB/PqqE/SkfB family radical SAM enzyme
MLTTANATTSPPQTSVPPFVELEITGRCQLECRHCYAESGPRGDRGTMTTADWEHVIDQAATIGVEMVQFIGGEPTLDPDLPRLIRYALGRDLKVNVYSNLVRITAEMWELFSRPGMALGTSWYSADPVVHAKITGRRTSFEATRASIIEAVRRGIPVRAAIVEIIEDQDIAEAEAGLRRLGVTDIRIRKSQGLGRAAQSGAGQDVSELCGRCGIGRAAIMPDGRLTPCVVGRWLDAGNVRETPLGDLLAGEAWQRRLAAVPRRELTACAPDCPPASDGNDCPPASCQ